MDNSLIKRQDAIDAIEKYLDKFDCIDANFLDGLKTTKKILNDLPSAQPEDWIERNKERILKAGMEGREIEFRIGGRLFAIREKAQ